MQGETPPAVCPVCGVGPDKFVKLEEENVVFKTASHEKIIVIGNGAAGTTACAEIRKRSLTCEIELISRENVIGYNRPMLTKGILADFIMDTMFIKPYPWYQENDVDITLGVEVVKIDKDKKVVSLSDGTTRKYDKLILATGAQCFIPPFSGADRRGVYSIRTLQDVNNIRDYIKTGVKEAAIIGGGVLGLEAAWELKKSGLDVTVVEAGPVIMGRQLDVRGAECLLSSMKKVGVNANIGAGIEEIVGDDFVTGIRLSDGKTIRAQLVIISTGVKQNVELAEQIGAKITRSIVVNEKMETGVKNIYACGDCAEYNGANYAIWPQAVDMGRIAGANAVGDEIIYEPTIPAVNFYGMDTSIFSIGDVGKNPDKKYEVKEVYDKEKLIYEKLYFIDDIFCGGILMGDTSRSAELMEAYKEKRVISKM